MGGGTGVIMKTATKELKHESDKNWLVGLLSQAQLRRYYGRLILVLEDGVIRRVVKEESLKPPNEKNI
jgi:hypothetical protein